MPTNLTKNIVYLPTLIVKMVCAQQNKMAPFGACFVSSFSVCDSLSGRPDSVMSECELENRSACKAVNL